MSDEEMLELHNKKGWTPRDIWWEAVKKNPNLTINDVLKVLDEYFRRKS